MGWVLIKIWIFLLLQKSKTQQLHPEEPSSKETLTSLDQKSSKFLPTTPVELTVAFGPYCPRCNLVTCGCSRNEVIFRRDSSANTCLHLQEEARALGGGRYIKSEQSFPTTPHRPLTRECHAQTVVVCEKAAGDYCAAEPRRCEKFKKEKNSQKMGQGDAGSCCAKYLLCMFNFVFFVSAFRAFLMEKNTNFDWFN